MNRAMEKLRGSDAGEDCGAPMCLSVGIVAIAERERKGAEVVS